MPIEMIEPDPLTEIFGACATPSDLLGRVMPTEIFINMVRDELTTINSLLCEERIIDRDHELRALLAPNNAPVTSVIRPGVPGDKFLSCSVEERYIVIRRCLSDSVAGGAFVGSHPDYVDTGDPEFGTQFSRLLGMNIYRHLLSPTEQQSLLQALRAKSAPVLPSSAPAAAA